LPHGLVAVSNFVNKRIPKRW